MKQLVILLCIFFSLPTHAQEIIPVKVHWLGGSGGVSSGITKAQLDSVAALKLDITTATATYEPKFSKNTAFNKNFDVIAGSVPDAKRVYDSIAVLRTATDSKLPANYQQNLYFKAPIYYDPADTTIKLKTDSIKVPLKYDYVNTDQLDSRSLIPRSYADSMLATKRDTGSISINDINSADLQDFDPSTKADLSKVQSDSSTLMAAILANKGITDNTFVSGLQALGSTIKATPLILPSPVDLASIALSSGTTYLQAVYLAKGASLSGVKILLSVSGSYTGTNYNGVGLYSVSGSTLTLVASSTNSGTLWTGSTGMLTVPFSSTYTATAGVYYIAFSYSASPVTINPSIYGKSAIDTNPVAFDGVKLGGYIGGISLPSTQAISGITANTKQFYVCLY